MAATSDQYKSSMNRLKYDQCTYAVDINQSAGPWAYTAGTPVPHCQPCLSGDARVAQGVTGASECATVPLVDVESDLHNITRQGTNCPRGKFQYGTGACTLKHYPECVDRTTLPVEDTRLNNPPCTLRGTGWNRWEWLCQDPQERVFVPFDFNVDTSILTKDNHRPLITKPLDQTVVLPRDNNARPSWIPLGCDGKPIPSDEPRRVTLRTCSQVDQINHGCGRPAASGKEFLLM